MRKHRYSNEFKVTAVKMANAADIETQAVAEALNIHPFMLSRWKKEYREGTLKGRAHPDLKGLKHTEAAVAEEKQIRALEAALRRARIENDLLKKPSSSIWKESGPLRLRRPAPGRVRGGIPLPALRCLHEWLLCLAASGPEPHRAGELQAPQGDQARPSPQP
jgi:transposase